MTIVGTFGLSLCVAVITVLITRWQSNILTREVEHQVAAASAVGAYEMSIADAPAVFRARIAQALDVATNLPTAILTLVAFEDLLSFPSWVSVIVAVCITLGAACIAQPKLAGKYCAGSVLGVTAVSIAVVTSNLVGLGIAVLVS